MLDHLKFPLLGRELGTTLLDIVAVQRLALGTLQNPEKGREIGCKRFTSVIIRSPVDGEHERHRTFASGSHLVRILGISFKVRRTEVARDRPFLINLLSSFPGG